MVGADDERSADRHALVIGSSDGIGLALTRRLLEAGWQVTGIARSPSPLSVPAYVHVVCDVRDDRFRSLLGDIDADRPVGVCVYGAGIGELLDTAGLASTGVTDQVGTFERGVRDLARLHSAYWGLAAAAHPQLGWLQTWEPTEGWQRGLRQRIPAGLERGVDVLPVAVFGRSADELLALWVRAVLTYRTGAMTLLHADAHIGNTYVLPDDRVGFLDWQVCRRGNCSLDLAYFVAGALTVEDRRASERLLVEAYVDALEVPSDERPTGDDVWLRYRASHAYGLAIWLSTLGSTGYQRPEVSLALAERYAHASTDGETIAALDRLAA